MRRARQVVGQTGRTRLDCIRYELRLLTTDVDFARIAEHEPLESLTLAIPLGMSG